MEDTPSSSATLTWSQENIVGQFCKHPGQGPVGNQHSDVNPSEVMLTIGVLGSEPTALLSVLSVTNSEREWDAGFLTLETCLFQSWWESSSRSSISFARDQMIIRTNDGKVGTNRRVRRRCQNQCRGCKTSWCCRVCIPRGQRELDIATPSNAWSALCTTNM